MKTIVILLLFIGLFFVTNGIYEEKIKSVEDNPKIVYKFIPRTYYEEQLFDSNVTDKMSNMFNANDQPWFMRQIDVPSTKNGKLHDDVTKS